MKAIRFGIITIILLGSQIGFGQLSIVSPSSYIVDSVAYQNNNLHYHLTITNVSSNLTFSGNIGAGIFVDSTGTGGYVNVVQTDTIASILSITLIPGGSILIDDSTSTTINSTSFRNGINTVVIWPRANSTQNFVPVDTLRQNIYVSDYLNTKTALMTDKVVLYPNPFSAIIWIKNNSNNFVERVRVLDILGQEILTVEMRKNNALNLSKLLPGIYFIQLQSNDGKLTIIKTIKE